MDSRSGPEVPSKVHGFGEAVKRRQGQALESGTKGRLGRVLTAGFLAACGPACGPDLTKPEGALGELAAGCGNGDARALFPALDQRSRDALTSIAQARRLAREVILDSYPEEARAEALAQLGDASKAASGTELFGQRCDRGCVEVLCQGVSAPATVEHDAGLALVRTVRGASIALYREHEHYGVIWHPDELARERKRAFAELSTIKANAKVYAQGKTLR
jgi:hypothetical protein